MREFDEVAAAVTAVDAALAGMPDTPASLVDSMSALTELTDELRGHVVVPAPKGFRAEYGVVWHGSEELKRERAIRMHEQQFPSRARAVERGEALLGLIGITCYTIQVRRHYFFAEGSGLDSLSTEWIDDVEPASQTQDPHTQEGAP